MRAPVGLLAVFLVVSAALAGPGDAPPAAPGARCAAGWTLLPSASGPQLLGRVDEATILRQFPDWPQDLADWTPDADAVATLATVTEPVDILCVLGTWCSDSQREVPRFWRLLAAVQNDHLAPQMVAVGRADDVEARDAVAGLHVGDTDDYRAEHGITNVPTFIVSVAGREIGRIVETPTVSLGADLVAILVQGGVLAGPGATSDWH